MLAYYSNIIIDRVDSGAPLTRGSIIVDIDRVELTIMVVMTFLIADCSGEPIDVPAHECHPGCGILVPLAKES